MGNRSLQLTSQIKQRVLYKDFGPNLDLAPVTGELLILKNSQAIMQSIYNLIFTYPTERYYQPLLGSTVSRGLFDFVDGFSEDQIVDSITTTISRYEPRATNLNVAVSADPVENEITITVSFNLNLISGQRITMSPIVIPIRG